MFGPLQLVLVFVVGVLAMLATDQWFRQYFPKTHAPLFSRDIARFQKRVDDRLYELFKEMWVHFELEEECGDLLPETKRVKKEAWSAHRAARIFGFEVNPNSRSYFGRYDIEPSAYTTITMNRRKSELRKLYSISGRSA